MALVPAAEGVQKIGNRGEALPVVTNMLEVPTVYLSTRSILQADGYEIGFS
jgi:hypothetical protein